MSNEPSDEQLRAIESGSNERSSTEDIAQRIVYIERQLARYARLDECITYWHEVIIRQTAESDKWDAAIKESQSMLRLRQNERDNRLEITAKLNARLRELKAKQLQDTLEQLGDNLPPQFRELLAKLKGSR